MSNKTLVWLAAGAAFLWWLTAKVVDLSRLTFKVVGVSSVGADAGNAFAQLQILIVNPTNSSFPLYNMEMQGEIICNGMLVGHATSKINTLLVPGSQIVVPLVVTMGAGNFAGGIAALIAAASGVGAQFKFVGTLGSGIAQLPLSLEYKIG